jgi:hypothetical protein
MKLARRLPPTLFAIILALGAIACANHPVTLHGVEVSDPFAVNAANRLAQLETTLVTTGDLLLAARSHFTNAQWDRIADTSHAALDALTVARANLSLYVDQVTAAENTGATRDALQKSIDVLTFLATSYVAYQGGGS